MGRSDGERMLNKTQQTCGHGAHLLGPRPLQEHRGCGVWQRRQSHACGRGLSIPVEVDSHKPHLHDDLDLNKDLGHGQASQTVLAPQPSPDTPSLPVVIAETLEELHRVWHPHEQESAVLTAGDGPAACSLLSCSCLSVVSQALRQSHRAWLIVPVAGTGRGSTLKVAHEEAPAG